MQRISVNLWFDTQAEEAANFYTSIFKHSKIKDITRYGEAGSKAAGRPTGTVTSGACRGKRGGLRFATDSGASREPGAAEGARSVTIPGSEQPSPTPGS